MVGHTVIFQPSGRRGTVEGEKTLLEAARELGVDIESVCGGSKICGKCKVKLEEGFFEKFGIDSRSEHLSPVSDDERRLLKDRVNDNYRLACKTVVRGDVLVFVPEESRGAKQVILETGKDRVFVLNPAVKKYYVEMSRATLHDYRDDLDRLRAALYDKYALPADLAIDYMTLLDLPHVIREGDWKLTATVWQDREIIRVEPGLSAPIYGLAVDVGTTTVAAYLCDLRQGQVVHTDSLMNPQVRYGEDVLSRVTYVMMNEDGQQKLHQAIIEGLNTLAGRMSKKAGVSPRDIHEMVLVGNTVMHHLLLNIDPRYVGRSPFVPAVKDSLDIKARELGIGINPAGYIHVLPIEAGFVGADNVGVLIAEEPYMQAEEIRMLIDIGTNGEIDLGNSRRLMCTSCATGPALEGAQIRFGMRAAPGAIEKVRIDPATLDVRYKVVGQDRWYPDLEVTQAKGICGSGIIDAVAEMFKAGIILKSGKFNMKLDSPRIRRGEDGKPEFVLAWAAETSIGKDITITIGDVRAVQLAKAALYVGGKFLMRKLGVSRVDSVTLAGAFGSYIDKESAILIGMFPDCPLEKVTAVGNAAGDGAKVALFDIDKRREAVQVARSVEFVETAVEEEFQQEFALAMAFPHSRDPFPHIQQVLDEIAARTAVFEDIAARR